MSKCWIVNTSPKPKLRFIGFLIWLDVNGDVGDLGELAGIGCSEDVEWVTVEYDACGVYIYHESVEHSQSCAPQSC